jgi:membrane fusion protein (multidrug efflux system)
VTPQTAIALVVDMDKVKIALNIPEKYLPDISLNQVADIYVDAYPEERFTGTVTKISPVFDLDTRTAPIKITIDNKGHRLKSGMFARVSLITKEIKGAILVLKEAVMGKEPDLYVYTVEDNMAILKRIKVGIRQNGYFEVKEGLKQGDMVVIMGQQMLKDGAKVKME